MCSIFGVFNPATPENETRQMAIEQSNTMIHRGPDSYGVFSCPSAVLVHNRISIVDVFKGGQPLYNKDCSVALVANGEIYNHQQIRADLPHYAFSTESDCEAILAAYIEYGASCLQKLRGMFAFAILDQRTGNYLIGRDHMGILSLYYGYDKSGALYVASEMKALINVCLQIEILPPGHYLSNASPIPVRYYDRDWQNFDSVKNWTSNTDTLRNSLEDAVKSHMMSDVSFGLLLSGGLDSSLISSIAVRKHVDAGGKASDLFSFSIGLKDSPDLTAAREMAAFLGTQHFEHVYSLQEGLDAIRKTIWHVESYDVTTIRASTPMQMLARKIRGNGVKVVLTGDGSDEAFGGYLYFHKAPSPRDLHEECLRKLSMMHMYDCMRVNKTLLSWGVEPRVPFLDRDFLDIAMRIDPRVKMCGQGKMEKHILRETFADYLPASIAWRQKEQSSDGVGYGWIDGLKALASDRISDRLLDAAKYRFPHNTPTSKEAYFYRQIFEEIFPHRSAPFCAPGGKTAGNATEAAATWLGSMLVDDPSGRAVLGIHSSPIQASTTPNKEIFQHKVGHAL
jgi:asparagine synthase (glutamine-hydrolysing)